MGGLKKVSTDVGKFLNLSIKLYLSLKNIEVEKLDPFLNWWVNHTYGVTMYKSDGKLKEEQKVLTLISGLAICAVIFFFTAKFSIGIV